MKAKKNNIIRHFNKQTGVTYMYWGHSEYCKDTKKVRVVKKAIGKLNVQGVFVPNMNFLEMSAEEQTGTGLVKAPISVVRTPGENGEPVCREKFYGWVSVIEAALEREGILDCLRQVFPKTYGLLITLVESLMCSSRPLYRPKRFHDAFWHYNMDLPSEDDIASALEAARGPEIDEFFNLFGKTRPQEGGLMFCPLETASIPTCSTMPGFADMDCETERDADLARADLLMVCEEESGIPLCCRKISGNILDSGALAGMRSAAAGKNAVLVLGQRFWSMESIRAMASSDLDFIMRAPSLSPIFADAVDDVLDRLTDSENFVPELGKYRACKDVALDAPERGGAGSKTLRLHVFLDPQERGVEQRSLASLFVARLAELKDDLSKWKRDSFFGDFYDLVLDRNGKPVDAVHNREAQKRMSRRCGVHICLGPAGCGPAKIQESCDRMDLLEKNYESFQSRMLRPGHSIDENLDGKLFLVCLQTAIEMALRKRMKEWALDRKYTLEDLQDEVACARFRVPSTGRFSQGRWTGLSRTQQIILHSMGVPGMERLTPDIENLAQNEKIRRMGLKPKRERKKAD